MNTRRWKLGLLGMVASGLLLAGCGGADTAQSDVAVAPGQPVAASELPQNVDVGTVEELRGREDVVLVDVREPNEYAAGHIPGTLLIPLGQLQSRLSEIPKDKTVVAVCRTGRRSGQATDLLRRNDFDAHNMSGGMQAWAAAGYEVQ